MQKLERGEDQQIEMAETHAAEPARNNGARGVRLSALLEGKRRSAEELGPIDGIRASASLLELSKRSMGITGRDIINSLVPVGSLSLAADMRQALGGIATDWAISLLGANSIAHDVMKSYQREWQEKWQVIQKGMMADQLAAIDHWYQGIADIFPDNYLAAMVPWPTLYPEAPRRQVYAPEPEPTAEEPALNVVHLQGDWQAALTAMIHDGRVSPAELIQLGLAHSEQARPGQKLPPWEEIEAICLDYERNRRRYQNQEVFAHKHGISLATLKRYRKLWRAGRSM